MVPATTDPPVDTRDPAVVRETGDLRDRDVFLSLLLFCGGLALLQYQVIEIPYAEVRAHWHTAILNHTAPYPDAYRLLSPMLAQGLASLGLSLPLARAVILASAYTAAFFVFYRYLRDWFSPAASLAGVFVALASVPFTFLFHRAQYSDPINFLVFVVALRLLQTGRDRWMGLVVVAGMFNRETAILIPLLMAAVSWGTKPGRAWLLNVSACGALALAIYLGLRLAIGWRAPYTPTSLWYFWTTNVGDWRAWVQLAAFFHALWWLSFVGWRRKPVFLRRVAVLIPLFFAVYLSVGLVRETRLFLPLLPVMIPLSLWTVPGAASTEP